MSFPCSWLRDVRLLSSSSSTVLDHQFNGRVHIVPTISAEEAK